MIKPAFAHVDTWVFDLDHTLYPPQTRLFDQIDLRMTAFIMRELNMSRDEANTLRSQYWHGYGTTLAGLMREHAMPPQPFLDEVHDIDFSVLEKDVTLRRRIEALPGRKIIYTNGHGPYAKEVIAARGLTGCFDAIYGVEHADYLPKPERAAFEKVFGIDGFDPRRGAMFEDDARNLRVPHALGLRCVHVAPDRQEHAHVHHHTDDLSAFLGELT